MEDDILANEVRSANASSKEAFVDIFATLGDDELAFAQRLIELGLAEFSSIRSEYWSSIFDAVTNFLSGNGARSPYEKAASKAMFTAFRTAAEQAYRDVGAELPLDAETSAFVSDASSAEAGYIVDMFGKLLMLRKEEGENAKWIAQPEAAKRADAYAHTLDLIYANAKLLGAPNVMLTFEGTDGQESCTDCRKYKGKRHKAKWWVAKEAVPPSRNFECHGYRCQHHLVDDSGKLYTI